MIKLNPTQKVVFALVSKERPLSTSRMAHILNIPLPTINKNIKKLVGEGYIERAERVYPYRYKLTADGVRFKFKHNLELLEGIPFEYKEKIRKWCM